MKWHKVDCTGRDDEFEAALQKAFGNDGLVVWSRLLKLMAVEIEKVLEDFESGKTNFPLPRMTIGCKFLAERCNVTADRLLEILRFIPKQKKFREYVSDVKPSRGKAWVDVVMPKFLADSDKYANTLITRVCKKRKLPLEEIRGALGLTSKSLDSDWSVADQRVIPEERSEDERGGEERSGDERSEEAPAGGEPVETLPAEIVDASPPPPGAPQSLVPSPSRSLPPAPLALVETRQTETRVDRPHAYSLSLLLPAPFSFNRKQADQIAHSRSVAEIAAVLREAGGKKGPGSYANWVFTKGHGAKRALEDGELDELRRQIQGFEKLYAVMKRAHEDPYDFAARNAPGIRLGHGNVMRAAP